MRKEGLENLTHTGYVKEKNDQEKAVDHVTNENLWSDGENCVVRLHRGSKVAKGYKG